MLAVHHLAQPVRAGTRGQFFLASSRFRAEWPHGTLDSCRLKLRTVVIGAPYVIIRRQQQN